MSGITPQTSSSQEAWAGDVRHVLVISPLLKRADREPNNYTVSVAALRMAKGKEKRRFRPGPQEKGICANHEMRVLVVSSHQLFGRSLVTLLQSQLADDSIEAALCDVPAVASRVRTWSVSVILVEAVVDFAGALACVQAICSALPRTGVVILGPSEDREMAYAAIRAGADGYVAADAAAGSLSHTLREVMHGNTGLPRGVSHHVVRKLRQAIRLVANSGADGSQLLLTPQQREILISILQGHRTRAIANHLGITEASVVKHLQHLAETLQAGNPHEV